MYEVSKCASQSPLNQGWWASHGQALLAMTSILRAGVAAMVFMVIAFQTSLLLWFRHELSVVDCIK